MNYEELKSRDIKDLRVLAAQYSIKTHPKHKAETIAKLIVEHVQAKPKATEAMKHPAEQPVKAALVIHTQEEVDQIVAPFAKKDGFQSIYPGDDTVIFKYKGAEESLHLSTSLRTIRMKAESVSKGARKMFTVKNADGNDVMMVGV